MPKDKKPNVATATRAVRRGGRSLSAITGNPADANIKPTPTENQRRLGNFLKAGGFLPSNQRKKR